MTCDAAELQDLSRVYLAHHKLESEFIVIIIIIVTIILVLIVIIIVAIIIIIFVVIIIIIFVVIIIIIIVVVILITVDFVVLLSRGAMRTMMITGDYHHTAIAVARGAGMLPTGAKLVILEAAAQASKMRSALKGDLARTMATCAAPLRVSFDLAHEPHAETRSEGCGAIKLQPAQALLPVANQLVQSLPEHVQGQSQSQAVSAPKHSSPPAQELQMQVQDWLESPSERLQDVGQQRNTVQAPSKLAWANDSAGDAHAHMHGHPPQPLLPCEALQQEHVQPLADDPNGSQPLPSKSPSVQDHPMTQDDLSCLRPPVQGMHRAPSTGLLFTSEGYSPEDQPQTALEALQSIAQGQAQCCVTGQAFEYLLQHAEPAVIESVMQHAVVFARMQSHQKGQVMELLSSRGLDRVMADQQQHIPVFPHVKIFCGALHQVIWGLC